MAKFHHMLDGLGGMHDHEKAAVVQYADVKGLSVQRVIVFACREFLLRHADELAQAKAEQDTLKALVPA